ncbi:lipopolysaccharide transport periplasmic protein LptA [Massilia yuzhufengensis]|uniref:Lipopolysaccharide export system protein LptA n=1 Tax=Massilia yuzhufengensis TaxID=1164594 RepID=A0A1I1PBG8_9BURK|nr:lipopolysaccharide transport periplasmic protein LptA [Massilia yuzhufengensis]SFD04998.1 lipopolysaccharide export system protein LptA [Massilia yuzhufengensis]
MKRLLSRCLPVLLLASMPAAAEKNDAFQPTRINCRSCDANGLSGIMTMSGGVDLTRGTLRIDADSGRVEQSPEGYQRVTLEADPGKKVRFRQKGDGPGEQWMDGEARRIEYDERSATVKLFSAAKMQRTIDGRPSQQAEGEYISYDSRTEVFTLRNTNTGEDRPGAGRNTIILQPRRSAPAQAAAGAGTP